MRAAETGSVAVAVALALVGVAPEAHAYCRTTSCDAVDSTADCKRDADGCSTEGEPLAWWQRCITYNVQVDGSERRGFEWEELDALVSTGFRQWQSVSCGSARPSFQIINLNETEGPAECAEPEYNKDGANANVWMFRDGSWPYQGAGTTLALTTVSFLTRTGQIVDADVEINTFATTNFTTTDQPGTVGTDLQSVVTHEAGHFLGLAHSAKGDATMNSFYRPTTTDMRSLDADDVAGLCEIYPPGRDVPACDASEAEPFGGFDPRCDQPATSTTSPLSFDNPDPEKRGASCQCDVARTSAGHEPFGAALALAGLVAVGTRRRSRR